MPAKGKSKVSPKQRATIATGVLQGKRHKDLAAETGLSVYTVDRVAIDPRTKSMIAEYKQQHEAKLREGFSASLKTIRYYIGNERTRRKEDGALAIRASSEMIKLITAGEQKLDVASSGGGDFTFAELLSAYLIARARATPEELAELV
jgi:hypothetical protein